MSNVTVPDSVGKIGPPRLVDRPSGDPADVACRLRRHIARHAWYRRVKLALAGELQHLAGLLLAEADTHSRVIARLRLDAQRLEQQAERLRRPFIKRAA